MQLYCWRGTAPNFGDELNRLLWPGLLPGFFDEDPAELFLGIGSIFDAPHDLDAVKLVAGAGYGGYAAPPVLDAKWIIHWVRGPRTARRLGLPEATGLGDPAMLLSEPHPNLGGQSIGFMPHFQSLERGVWAEAAAAAGVTLIDPRGDPVAVVSAICASRVLLSEAMHGVIVADAMRVPWIALHPIASVHCAKWHDWADTLGLRVRFQPLVASSLHERLYATPVAAKRPGRRILDLARPVLEAAAHRRFVERAAQSLSAASAVAPQLSTATALDRCRTRMLERLDVLRHNPWLAAASALHRRGHSA